MRYAFNLLELLLVIIIIGILLASGAQVVRPRHLRDDAQFIKAKILKTQNDGIFFDTREFYGGEISSDKGCITLDRDSLSESATDGKVSYTIYSNLSGELAGKRLCFDYLGRPALDNHNNLLNEEKNLTISYNSKEIILSLEPVSGYVIIYKK